MSRLAASLLLGLAVAGPVRGSDEPPVADVAATENPAMEAPRHGASTPAAVADAPASASAAVAQIDLETTAITGSQELPRVLVIVPWKKAQPGQIEGRPANSLLDEALAPVDREVFARQIDFHTQITTDKPEE